MTLWEDHDWSKLLAGRTCGPTERGDQAETDLLKGLVGRVIEQLWAVSSIWPRSISHSQCEDMSCIEEIELN